MRTLICVLIVAGASCGVPKEYVKQQTRAAFDNTVSVAAHVKTKCGDKPDADENCKQASDKLGAICQSLDELAKQAGGPGFDCAAWKVKP
jgi:hypothetical protein